MSQPHTTLEARGVGKRFPGVVALADVSVTLNGGEVLAVVGENGAGKSTLMKILAGVYQPDAGELFLNGQPIQLPNPAVAMGHGIVLIHQELNLAENLSVLDNLFLGREQTGGGWIRWLRRKRMRLEGAELLKRVGLPEKLIDKPVSLLSPGQKQLLEIAKALGLNAKVLIMDEPTSSLTQTETDRLYTVIDDLKAADVAVLYISHRLAEVMRCADRAIVLRDGKRVCELPKAEITQDALVRSMVGRELTGYFPKHHRVENGPTVLKLSQLTYADGPSSEVSFELRAGEVVGMAGLVGAGRTELAEAVFGIRAISSGQILLQNKALRIRTPKDAIRAGIFLVPEDRRLHGLILQSGVRFNLSLPNLGKVAPTPLVRWLDRRAESRLAVNWIDQLNIRTANANQTVGLLSGGNQQKVVFGKWLARGPAVLILDEPTRGVDVGAKAEIYRLIDELAGQGVAVWMISSDMEELLGMSDRILVMHEGVISGELQGDDRTEANVMRLATGGLAE